MTILNIYILGGVFFALVYGFRTPWGSRGDGPKAIITVLGWPIILIVAFGEAARMFSPKRNAEDIANGMEDAR